MDSTVHRILQARILEWVAFPSPGDLTNPGIKPTSPTLQEDSLPSEPAGKSLGGVEDPNVQSIAGPNLPFQDQWKALSSNQLFQPTPPYQLLSPLLLPSTSMPISKFMGSSLIHIEYPSHPLHSHPPKIGHLSSKLSKWPPNSFSASDPSPVQSVHSPQVARMSF